MRRRVTARRRMRELSEDEFWELLLGPHGENQSVFESDQERRDTWRIYRAVIMADLEPGQLPWAAIQYEHQAQG